MPRLKLQKNYGLTTALTLGIGTMIGAGIFILPSFAAGRAGPAASVAYLIGGLIAIITAISLSELATGMSKAGGSYYFINRSLGPFFGTITGLGMWMGLIFASAFYMIGFEYYLSYFFELDIWIGILTLNNRFIAILVTIVLIGMNFFGTKGAGSFQNVIVIVLLIILSIFAIGGMMHIQMNGNGGRVTDFAPEGWAPVANVAALVFIGFMGFEVVATMAEEIREPEKNLWRAMIGSVVVVTILYMLIMLISIGLSPPENGLSASEVLSEQATPISFAAEQFLGGPGGILITIAALLATISSANASILSASRIGLAMGEDKILHPWASKLHETYATPSNSIVLTGILILVFLLIGEVEALAEIAGFMFLLTFILVHWCVIILRKTKPEWYTPSFTSPFFPYLQYSGAILCIFLMFFMSRSTALAGLCMMGISVIWYHFWSKKKSKVVGEVTKVFSEKKVEEAKAVIQDREENRRKILVPFSNALYEPWKMRLASALATKNGLMVRLNIVEIPDQTPIESAMDHIVVDNINKMDKVKNHDEKVEVEKSYKQLIAHSVPYSIVDVSRQEECELIFLTRSQAKLPVPQIRETFTNFVLHKAKIDIGVLIMSDEVRARFGPNEQPKIKRILVPYDDNPHTILAMEFAKKISIAEDATVTLFMVSFKKDLKENEAKMGRILENFKSEDFTIEPRISTGRSPVKEIIAASKDFDLIVMGASRMWVLNKFLLGSIPDRVVTESDCPVLVAKKWEGTALSQVKGRI
jgi:basic amino acid/polyamine antiporter, APA family